jgi:hypothetical protein
MIRTRNFSFGVTGVVDVTVDASLLLLVVVVVVAVVGNDVLVSTVLRSLPSLTYSMYSGI